MQNKGSSGGVKKLEARSPPAKMEKIEETI